MKSNGNNSGSFTVVAIIFTALFIIVCLSIVPWNRITNGVVKDFNIFSDLISSSDTLGDTTTDLNDAVLVDILPENELPDSATCDSLNCDSIISIPEPINPKIGDVIAVEDYSSSRNTLKKIQQKLSSGDLTRIAFLGDSYIEGDIITQDLRAGLQDRFGGSGVGYMNLHSDFPGFRRSVIQSDNKNWANYTATQRGKEKLMGISQQYSVANGTATSTYKGSSKISHASSWDISELLVSASHPAVIYTKVNNGDWVSNNIAGNGIIESIRIENPNTKEFSVKVSSSDVAVLGCWLYSGNGVQVDCMSSRGIPGYTLANTDPDLTEQMSRFIDYDLIILEFGVNAMSAKQTDYSHFSKKMVEVIENLRRCYPNAAIMLLGVGDRGQKRNGVVTSMKAVSPMIEAQRLAARETGAMFWDTREAMGGENSIVEWSKSGKANKDYVHLTHKGGADIAQKLIEALTLETPQSFEFTK